MASEFSSTVKISVPFTGHAEFEVDVRKSDHDHEFADARQIIWINCRLGMDEKGRLTMQYPNDGDIRVTAFEVNPSLDVNNAREIVE